ncbi:MAG: endolytic transglycosylase MltG [Deltaproteobacteria bacterium]|nr:endolytic transglycosylase MltG [Deltaproteobacteria bacterium]
MKRALAALALLVLLGAALAVVVAQRWWRESLRAPGRSEAAIVEVPSGASFRSVAAQLEAQGVIRDARAFGWLARIEKKDGALKVGEYQIEPGLDARAVLDLLVSGRVRLHGVAIPEGLTLVEIAQRVADAGFGSASDYATLARDPAVAKEHGVPGDTLEGFLFPETYRFPRGAGAREVIEAQLAQFDRAWAEVAPLAQKRGMAKRDVVILASLIEKETGAPEERPLISAVFHNRLGKRMRLETDPSVIYGIPNFDGNLRRIHLEDETNPYNTYRIPALPPGPIANPGLASLRAAVEPTPGVEFLFFVARGDGTHEFTTNYRDHVNAVNRWQLRRERR